MEKRSPAVPEPMEMLAGHITDYLHYLKHDCGLRVSIHEFQRIAAPFGTGTFFRMLPLRHRRICLSDS